MMRDRPIIRLPNPAADRIAGSPSLAAAGHRERSAPIIAGRRRDLIQ
jgi:hypothetical protein